MGSSLIQKFKRALRNADKFKRGKLQAPKNLKKMDFFVFSGAYNLPPLKKHNKIEIDASSSDFVDKKHPYFCRKCLIQYSGCQKHIWLFPPTRISGLKILAPAGDMLALLSWLHTSLENTGFGPQKDTQKKMLAFYHLIEALLPKQLAHTSNFLTNSNSLIFFPTALSPFLDLHPCPPLFNPSYLVGVPQHGKANFCLKADFLDFKSPPIT